MLQGFVFPGTESLDPREVFAGPGYQAPRQRTDPAAVVTLVTTVLSPFPGFNAIIRRASQGPFSAGAFCSGRFFATVRPILRAIRK